jgi:hypothetical protein
LINTLNTNWANRNQPNCKDYNANTNNGDNNNKSQNKDTTDENDQDFIGLLVSGALEEDDINAENNTTCTVLCDSSYQNDLSDQSGKPDKDNFRTTDASSVVLIVSVVAGGIAGVLALIKVILVRV